MEWAGINASFASEKTPFLKWGFFCFGMVVGAMLFALAAIVFGKGIQRFTDLGTEEGRSVCCRAPASSFSLSFVCVST